MHRSRDNNTPIRLKKKRRVPPTNPMTFRDVHAARRDGSASHGHDARADELRRTTDAASGSSPRGSADVVINHVLV